MNRTDGRCHHSWEVRDVRGWQVETCRGCGALRRIQLDEAYEGGGDSPYYPELKWGPTLAQVARAG